MTAFRLPATTLFRLTLLALALALSAPAAAQEILSDRELFLRGKEANDRADWPRSLKHLYAYLQRNPEELSSSPRHREQILDAIRAAEEQIDSTKQQLERRVAEATEGTRVTGRILVPPLDMPPPSAQRPREPGAAASGASGRTVSPRCPPMEAVPAIAAGPVGDVVTIGTRDGSRAYDFLDKRESSDLHGGDFYLSGGSCAQFWANNRGQRGLIDLGDIGVPLDQVRPPPPRAGYDKQGVRALVGHTYVALPKEGRRGFIIFRVLDLDSTGEETGAYTIQYIVLAE